MPLAGHGLRPTPLRRRASRPQLKRDPLGSHYLSLMTVPNPWLMFALGVVPTNGLWFTMARIVRRRGLPFPIWNWGMFTGLSSFQRVIREEAVPGRRASYRWLAIAFYASFAWCLFWFVRILVTGAGP